MKITPESREERFLMMSLLCVLLFSSDISSGRTDLAVSAAPYLPNQVTDDKGAMQERRRSKVCNATCGMFDEIRSVNINPISLVSI